jgi:hypothetical protein
MKIQEFIFSFCSALFHPVPDSLSYTLISHLKRLNEHVALVVFIFIGLWPFYRRIQLFPKFIFHVLLFYQNSRVWQEMQSLQIF